MNGARANWLLQEVAIDVLREVSARCASAGLPFLPVKGVVTGRLLYGDVADRLLTDVDIRIRPKDFTHFLRLGRAHGWRCVRIARTYHNLVYEFPGLSLDVEGHVGPPGLCALSTEAMLSRASRRELAPGLAPLIPELHDHAVLLVVNVFKDKMAAATPRAVADVERIAEHPAFQPETFCARAVQARIATLAWLVATWMESRGSKPWARVRSLLERRARIRRGYTRLFQRLLSRADRREMALRVLARVGADSRAMQGRALVLAFAWELEMKLRSRIAARAA